MLRLLIEDVTLTRNADRTIGVDVRFKGGASKSLHLPATGLMFSPVVVGTIRRRAGLKNRYERLREQDLLTLREAATKLDISTKTLRQWANAGIIKTYRYNDKNSYLYELDGKKLISNLHENRQKGRRNQAFYAKVNERISEVQYEV